MRHTLFFPLLAYLCLLPLHGFLLERSRSKVEKPHGRCEPMFVAVLTTPKRFTRRKQIREMWHEGNADWGKVMPKFAICIPRDDDVPRRVQIEEATYNDLLFLDCHEGYRHGKLTAKVRLAMEAYLERYSDEYKFFMKIDDDTFISTRRLCDLFRWRQDNSKNNSAAYFGVFAEGPHESLKARHFPNRDKGSKWYEPLSKFSGSVFPTSAKGGPGYILPRDIVKPIIEEGIAQDNELNNEDKAVGVWVDKLQQQGWGHIDIVNIPGTDGYDVHAASTIQKGPFKKYPYTLHHNLTGDAIQCLHRINMAKNPDMPVDGCFTPAMMARSSDEKP